MTPTQLTEPTQADAVFEATMAKAMAAIARAKAAREALDDPDTAPNLSPAARRALEERHTQLFRYENEIYQRSNDLKDPKMRTRMKDLTLWRDTLIEVREELCADLLATNPKKVPYAERSRAEDKVLDIKMSIQTIDRGAQYVSGEYPLTGAALPEKLRARGFVPLPGQVAIWNGRGSLANTEGYIQELQERIDDLYRRLDEAMTSLAKYLQTF